MKIKAWAVIGKALNYPPQRKLGILHSTQQYPVLEIYLRQEDARRGLAFIRKDSVIRYKAEIVQVNISAIKKRGKAKTNDKKVLETVPIIDERSKPRTLAATP